LNLVSQTASSKQINALSEATPVPQLKKRDTHQNEQSHFGVYPSFLFFLLSLPSYKASLVLSFQGKNGKIRKKRTFHRKNQI